MHEILHLIGLCPDSFAHLDLLDIIVPNYETIVQTINLKFKHYVIKR